MVQSVDQCCDGSGSASAVQDDACAVILALGSGGLAGVGRDMGLAWILAKIEDVIFFSDHYISLHISSNRTHSLCNV